MCLLEGHGRRRVVLSATRRLVLCQAHQRGELSSKVLTPIITVNASSPRARSSLARRARGGGKQVWRAERVMMQALLALKLVSPFATASSNEGCLFCHSSQLPVRRIDPALTIDPKVYLSSIHGRHITCDQCHVGVGNDLLSHRNASQPVQCTRCHGPSPSVVPEAHRRRADSIHQRWRRAGVVEVPQCKDCHGYHNVEPASSPTSPVNKKNIRLTCGQCHGSPGSDIARKAPQTAISYDESIHGRKHGVGKLRTATCTDCHLPHNPKARASAEPIDKMEIPGICGKCHKNIYEEYRNTIHGRDLARGNRDVPACTDCHGEHNIRPPAESESSVSPLHVVATCTKCHENKLILRKYGLPSGRYSTYRNSFHGISNRFGDVRAANCASCHTAHSILPANDPRSSVHPSNRPRTCGKCHKGATANFARGTVHLSPSQESDAVIYWVGVCYKALVGVIIAMFACLISLDLRKRFSLRQSRSRGLPGGDER